MPPLERPPLSPQAQAQMGPPGGPAFGAGIGQAQQQQDKSPTEVAVSTVEKILMGVQDETFRPYGMKAIATLKVGLAMAQQKGPQSLDDLIQDGYLRAIPEDPMTRSKDTWATESSDSMVSLDETEPGITDVHSGSTDTGTDGQPYSSW